MAGTLEDKVLWERTREWGSEGFSEEMLEPELGVDWVTQKQGEESSPGRQSDRETEWGTRAPGLFEKPEGDHCAWSKVRRRVCERLDWRGGRA